MAVSKSWSKIHKDTNADKVVQGFTDFTPATQGQKRWHKGSHLIDALPLPDPNGNRAERRRAKKKKKVR